MGVAQRLGLDQGIESGDLVEAAGRWRSWIIQAPRLAQVEGLASLPGWLRRAEPTAADDVLTGLVRVGSPSGSDDRLAATAVAWVLLPGACRLANQLRTLGPDVDALVASQLWLEIRSFEWWRLRKVAANVLARTRCGVLRECGVSSRLRRVDPVWAATVPQARVAETGQFASGTSAATELRAILDDASDLDLVTSVDRKLLSRLLAHADELAGASGCRGRGGLLADRLVSVVAADLNVSPATVRRRTRRIVAGLAAAHRAGLVAA